MTNDKKITHKLVTWSLNLLLFDASVAISNLSAAILTLSIYDLLDISHAHYAAIVNYNYIMCAALVIQSGNGMRRME